MGRPFITVNRQRAELYAAGMLPDHDDNGDTPLQCVHCKKIRIWKGNESEIDGWAFAYTHQICDDCRKVTGWDEVQGTLRDAENNGAQVEEPNIIQCKRCKHIIEVVADEPIYNACHRAGFCTSCMRHEIEERDAQVATDRPPKRVYDSEMIDYSEPSAARPALQQIQGSMDSLKAMHKAAENVFGPDALRTPAGIEIENTGTEPIHTDGETIEPRNRLALSFCNDPLPAEFVCEKCNARAAVVVGVPPPGWARGFDFQICPACIDEDAAEHTKPTEGA